MIRPGLFDSYERHSLLRSVNPAIKLVCHLAAMIYATIVWDIFSLAGLLLLGLVLCRAGARMSLREIARALIPFVLFGLGFFWMNAVFADAAAGYTPVARLGPLVVTSEGLANGVRFWLRALCFGVYSGAFVASSDPTELALSLSRQLKLPARIGYSSLVAYRYLPELQGELRRIRTAHRLRGVGEGDGIKGKIVAAYRYTIPLLTAAIRRAGRASDAMEARGFSDDERTWYRELRAGKREVLYALLLAAGCLAVTLLSLQLGHLAFWGGQLWG